MKRIFITLIMLAALMVAFIPFDQAQAYLVGEWKTCTVDNASTTSDALDLGDDFQYVQIYVPTITEGTVKLLVSESLDGTYAADNVTEGVVTSTGGLYTNLEHGGFRYIKIICGATQIGGDVDFRVRGWRP